MSPAKAARARGPFQRVNDFLCSIKLTIFVLITLALTSIFGTVIQQGQDPSVYVREYGEGVARIIAILDLQDMYHSWWFLLILSLLLANITFCSLRRLPHAVRLMRDRDPVFDGRPVAIHEKWEKVVNGSSVEEVAGKVEALLASRVGRPARREAEGKVYLYGNKGSWSRMGVYVTHFSLFLFALGAIIGAWTGYKGFVAIEEGTTVGEIRLRGGGVHDLGFQVRCDDFSLDYYPDGRIRDYISDLTVLEGGKEVSRQRIEVNSPLIHQGIYFYQSSYGPTSANLTVFGPRRNLIVHRKTFRQRDRIYASEGTQLILWDFPSSRQGTGVQVVLFQEGKEPRSVVVPPGMRAGLGGFLIEMHDFATMYTGLQVAKDPGVPVIWAGCILISIGCLVAFFVSHRRVWARVSNEGKAVRVFLGGNASRNRISFERWFGDLCADAQETFEK